MGFTIERATADDAETLSVLATEVWLDTYAVEGVSPAYARHLVQHYGPDAFRTLLAAPQGGVWLCHRDGYVLGYARWQPAPQPPNATCGTAELATLYVRRAHKRQGIGAALLRATLADAAQAGHRRAFLTVHHRNAAAAAFYHAQGMVPGGDCVFEFEGLSVPQHLFTVALAAPA